MTNPLAHTVAAEVRAEMARQRRTQGELGNQLGLSQAAVSRRLIGEVPFTIGELGDVADFLGITVIDLLSRADRPVAAVPVGAA